jgi:gliding motility-associated-like protein
MARIFLFLLLFSAVNTQAQNPEVCARLLLGSGQDSIVWTAGSCTNFGGYVLLGQQNGTGPFVRLDTLSGSATAAPNLSEELWYYQIGLLCNGVLTNLSTPVSNQKPITPDLLSVDIQNNIPVVRWSPSPSPEVIGYQLYKENPYGSGNYFPYPNSNSVITATTFVDQTATDLLARYAILAVSACNESLLGLGQVADSTTGPHTSIVVSANLQPCAQTVTLTWNAYENWRAGVQGYEIWLNENNTGFQLLTTVNNNTTSYVYENAQDNSLLEFRVEALEQNANNRAVSNEVALSVEANRPMDFIYLTALNIVDNSTLELTWEWDTDVDYASGDLLRGVDSTAMSSRILLPGVGSALNNFTDSEVATNEQPYFYSVQTVDDCGQTVTSNLGKTIFLEAKATPAFVNQISWAPAQFQYGTVQSYWLYKIVNGNRLQIATLGPNDHYYEDALNLSDESEANACYQVLANVVLHFPDGQQRFLQSQSNSACATQSSSLQVPNAIAPDGENRFFRPVVVFGQSIRNYSMLIYDRYGQELFRSTDLYDAWDGTRNGTPLPFGTYVYWIRYQAPNGTAIEQKGTVTLVR